MDLVLTGSDGISIGYLVVDVFCNLADFLNTVLPESLLPNLDLSAYTTYLGWLNWIVPVGAIADLFGAWCAALLGAVVAKTFADRVVSGLGDAAESVGSLVVAGD